MLVRTDRVRWQGVGHIWPLSPGAPRPDGSRARFDRRSHETRCGVVRPHLSRRGVAFRCRRLSRLMSLLSLSASEARLHIQTIDARERDVRSSHRHPYREHPSLRKNRLRRICRKSMLPLTLIVVPMAGSGDGCPVPWSRRLHGDRGRRPIAVMGSRHRGAAEQHKRTH